MTFVNWFSANKMKLLIDTNIIIGLEDAGEIEKRFADLLRKCSEYDVRVFVHEASKEDIGRDKNAERKAATLSKIAKFQILESVAHPGEDDLAVKYGQLKKANDIVDAKLLYSMEINAVDLLITEDDGLHRRAKKAGLNDRVMTVADILAWIKQTYEPEEVFLPAVQAAKAHGVNFNDPIFDELRTDYDGFDAWAAKCIKDHRDCWIIEDKPVLAGVVKAHNRRKRSKCCSPYLSEIY
jgi:rRNA-processing protein FCF1